MEIEGHLGDIEKILIAVTKAAIDEAMDDYIFVSEMQGELVWLVLNEVHGYTVMLPEDY